MWNWDWKWKTNGNHENWGFEPPKGAYYPILAW